MILMRAPLRISFIGGGTDYFDWFFKNRGEVLSVSIDRYVCFYLESFLQFGTQNTNSVTPRWRK